MLRHDREMEGTHNQVLEYISKKEGKQCPK